MKQGLHRSRDRGENVEERIGSSEAGAQDNIKQEGKTGRERQRQGRNKEEGEEN